MKISIRKQLYLAAVPLLVVLVLVIGSLAMRFYPLRGQIADLRGDLNELSLATDLTYALNEHAIAMAEALSGRSHGETVKGWEARLQVALDAWIGQKRDSEDSMEVIELEAVGAISRDTLRLRSVSQQVMKLSAGNRFAEARALAASDLWPLIASISRGIDERASEEGREINQSLGVIQELAGVSHTPGANRLHHEVQMLKREVAAEVEASRFARAVSLACLAYRYARFAGPESLDEEVIGTSESSSAFRAWTYVLERSSASEERSRLFTTIAEEYRRVAATRPEMLRHISLGQTPADSNIVADRLLELVHQYVKLSHKASGRSVSDVNAAAQQTLLLALVLGALALVGGLGIPAVIGGRTLRRIANLQESVGLIRAGHLDVRANTGVGDELGQLAGSFNEMARDLEQAAAGRELSDERFRQASRATNDVIWDWQIGPDSIWLNDSAKALLGIDMAAEVSSATWLEMIHPDDVQRVKQSVRAALRNGADLLSDQYRFRRSDGSYSDVFDRAVVVRDAAGRALRVIGAMVDLTSQRISEQTIASLSRQRQLLLDSVGDGIVGIEPTGEITFVNHGAVELLHGAADVLQGKHVHDVFHGPASEHERQSCPIQRTVVSGLPYAVVDDDFVRGNETKFAGDLTANPVIDEHGAIVGGVVCFRDVTEKRALDRMKSEFVSTVSHELRTPLTSIRAALGLLATGKFITATDRGRRMLDIAVTNTDRLVRLINDILDVEKLDSGGVIHRAIVDTGQLVREAVEGMRPMADKTGVVLSISAESAIILADADRITQTLTNLISNAIKFSPPESRVTIRTCINLGMWQCEVHDEGRGIPPDKLEVIFERFQQVDASDSREKGGTGLGLPICRSIVRQHGGRIWAESQFGHGSSFFFIVPLAGQEAREPPVVPVKRPILICDDDPSLRSVLSEVLRHHGYAVLTAATGEEALAAAVTYEPAAVLLDLKMSGMSGCETMRRLRAGASTRAIPILLISGYSPREAREIAGVPIEEADAYVQKPIDASVLFGCLDPLVGTDALDGTILIVEDDLDLAAMLSEGFARHGLSSRCAASGADAIEIARRSPPRLIVLDVHLPEVDAFAVVEWMRGVPELSSIPLVVYSGQELSQDERARLRLGPTEFFTKSRISPLHFEKRVIELLNIVTSNAPAISVVA